MPRHRPIHDDFEAALFQYVAEAVLEVANSRRFGRLLFGCTASTGLAILVTQTGS